MLSVLVVGGIKEGFWEVEQSLGAYMLDLVDIRNDGEYLIVGR